MWKYIFGVLFILIIIVSLVLVSKRFFKPQLPVLKPPAQTISSTKPEAQLTVVSTSPEKEATGSSIIQPIKVVFSQEISSNDHNQITLTTTPQSVFTKKLSPDQRSIEFDPLIPLKTDQKYLAIISLPNNSYTWSFTTTQVNRIPVADQLKIQSVADQDFGAWQANIYKNYPWYNKLPLQTTSYYIYFDLDKKRFISDLYPKTSSSTLVEDQVNQFKKDITNKLAGFGIDTARYEFEWNTHPEP